MADREQELFELVDEAGNTLGTELRSVVHRKGLLHRAVYVWVFRPDGALLIQRRSPLKQIGPGQLDLSVAEHLQPGENYVQGAVRGLAEELGIVVEPHQLRGPLAPTHRRELHQGDFHDCELVQSFRLNNYCGGISLDDGEVSETKWVALEELAAAVNTHPDEYTQWFLDEMVSLDWFRAMDDQQNPERQVGMQHAAQPCQPLAPQQLLGAA